MSPEKSPIVVLIWFRAEPRQNEDCAKALRELAARIEPRFAVRARFGWRDEPDKNRRTWLESWEPLDTSQEQVFLEALATEAQALGFEELAPGGRFVDVFHWAADSAPDAR